MPVPVSNLLRLVVISAARPAARRSFARRRPWLCHSAAAISCCWQHLHHLATPADHTLITLHPPTHPLLPPPFPCPPPPQAELTKDVERAKKLAEAEGRIKENRENEDVNRRAALLK